MKRSDKDPARRPNGEQGDAMTDDFVPSVRSDADEAETASVESSAASEEDVATDSGRGRRERSGGPGRIHSHRHRAPALRRGGSRAGRAYFTYAAKKSRSSGDR